LRSSLVRGVLETAKHSRVRMGTVYSHTIVPLARLALRRGRMQVGVPFLAPNAVNDDELPAIEEADAAFQHYYGAYDHGEVAPPVGLARGTTLLGTGAAATATAAAGPEAVRVVAPCPGCPVRWQAVAAAAPPRAIIDAAAEAPPRSVVVVFGTTLESKTGIDAFTLVPIAHMRAWAERSRTFAHRVKETLLQLGTLEKNEHFVFSARVTAPIEPAADLVMYVHEDGLAHACGCKGDTEYRGIPVMMHHRLEHTYTPPGSTWHVAPRTDAVEHVLLYGGTVMAALYVPWDAPCDDDGAGRA
jgi:hypothetical protein